MNSPYISIIMPMYCIENYITDAIESVLQQTFSNWELLVINDGSTDKSRDIAKSYESNDNRIVVLDKKNGGLSDARNFGLLHAKGEYIHFFDGDDIISPLYYEKLIQDNNQNSNIIISGYTVDYKNNGNSKTNHSIIRNDFNYDSKDPLSVYQFIQKYINYAWNKLFQKKFLYTNNLYFENGLYAIEDAEFMSRVLSFSPVISYCKDTGYHYINRERVSLGRMFNLELIGLSARKMVVESESFHSFTEEINNPIEYYPIVSLYRTIFHALFSYTTNMSISQYYNIINDINSNKELRNNLKESKLVTSKLGKIFRFLVLNKFNCTILLLYKIFR